MSVLGVAACGLAGCNEVRSEQDPPAQPTSASASTTLSPDATGNGVSSGAEADTGRLDLEPIAGHDLHRRPARRSAVLLRGRGLERRLRDE